jgi:hypothetical protein
VSDADRGIVNPFAWQEGETPAPPVLVRADALEEKLDSGNENWAAALRRLASDPDAKGINVRRLIARRS